MYTSDKPHTPPFCQTRRAVSWISRRTHTMRVTQCHVTIVSVQMQRAQIVHTPFTTVQVVQRSTIDIISETNRHQPLPLKRPVFVSKKISVITDDPLDLSLSIFAGRGDGSGYVTRFRRAVWEAEATLPN